MNSKTKCEVCKRDSIVFYCNFKENVSYFVGRTDITYSGWFCSECMKRIFLKSTVKTLFGTWWGIIGFGIGPYYIYNNIKEFFKFKINYSNK
jgi:hypothetical protein